MRGVRVGKRGKASKHFHDALDCLLRIVQPPAEHFCDADLRREQRQADEQHEDIAKKDHNSREEIALARDVGLLRLKHMGVESDMKGVGRTDEQMKPDHEPFPVPDEMTGDEHCNNHHGVEGEKIGRERDQEICFVHDHMPAFRGGFELFHAATEEPDPDGVCQFMAKDVDPHRLW